MFGHHDRHSNLLINDPETSMVVAPHLLSLNKLIEDFYLQLDDTSNFYIVKIFLEVLTRGLSSILLIFMVL